ncbi:MAG TPA: uroporphyrinogen-III C-methyltransferase [Planctomycetota bacterium]|nr:uroporphyrinogen-III C-methyltransferase [Planctomycetota bacterium]
MNIVKGKVYLAGAGPGDAGLLTLRVHELLRGADCLVYDALVSDEILAFASPTIERIYVGKRGRSHAVEQPDINRILAEKANENKSVLRLKGGDPYLFGRGAEEALYLIERGVSVEVIPGVTAGIAAPAYAGIPVTHREHASAVAFVTGHEDPTKPESALDWAALAKIGTLCFYMGVKNLGRITSELSKHLPASTPVAVIQWGSTPRQRTATGTLTSIVDEVARLGIQAPALTVVGEVVKYREQLNFFERRPLFGKRVLVTRARAQASVLADGLRERGANVFEFPTIRIEFKQSPELAKAAADLAEGRFEWLILTSVNGVDALFEELYRQKRDARAVKARVAAVGSATDAHLRSRGIVPDLVPPEYLAESIVESLKTQGQISGKRFLLARADIARSELPRALQELGGEVSDIVAYRTVRETAGQEAALAALEKDEIDIVTFTSASTARNFAEILGPERLKKVLASPVIRFLSIGPQTSKSMKEVGIPIHAEAEPHDIPGLINAVENAAQKVS